MQPQPVLIFAGGPIQDPESWSKALSCSTAVHAAALFLIFIFGFTQKPLIQTVLTEVNFLEVREPVQEIPGGASGAGTGGASTLGAPGETERLGSHPELKNVAPYSNPQGSPKGAIVTNESMSGPIIQSGEVGLIGKKKGALIPLAARTEGTPGKSLLPSGEGVREKGSPIALATEDVSAIRKRDKGLGAPLIASGISGTGAGGGSGNAIRGLAGKEAGARELGYEKLKANPMDDEKWGKQKGPFSMEGPLKYRRILKMNLPSYPRWAEEQGLESAVSIRLWVDPKGRVKETLFLEKGSGYTDIDRVTQEALKTFVFVPLPETVAQEDEWGIATFRFELKK